MTGGGTGPVRFAWMTGGGAMPARFAALGWIPEAPNCVAGGAMRGQGLGHTGRTKNLGGWAITGLGRRRRRAVPVTSLGKREFIGKI